MSRLLLTCRVTQIESFRAWINADEFDDKPGLNENNVIKSIQGEYTGSVKADYGTAGHLIIEDADKYRTGGGYSVTVEEKGLADRDNTYYPNTFVFTDAQVQPLLRFREQHPLMTREIALSKVYSTPRFDLIITGTSDHFEGITARDTKFKFSPFDVQDFVDSVQHKLYMDMAGIDIFYYDFFSVSKFEKMEDVPQSIIHECDSMMIRSYPAMQSDIQSVLNEFADFVAFKNLEPWMAITPEKYKRIIAGNPGLKKLLV